MNADALHTDRRVRGPLGEGYVEVAPYPGTSVVLVHYPQLPMRRYEKIRDVDALPGRRPAREAEHVPGPSEPSIGGVRNHRAEARATRVREASKPPTAHRSKTAAERMAAKANDPVHGPAPAWTRQTIVAAIKAHHARHGEPPSRNEWERSGGTSHPSAFTVRTVFGNWNAAIEAAGFTPRRQGHKKAAA